MQFKEEQKTFGEVLALIKKIEEDQTLRFSIKLSESSWNHSA